MSRPVIPLVATYRLQLRAEFGFADAAGLVPYLHGLGISHLYLSPVFQAVPGSPHGYDQCDPAHLSDDLGGEAGFAALEATAAQHSMGILIDIVPNHMATSPRNPYWWSLLREGRDGAAGRFFDVDWESGDPHLDGRVLVPVLGAPLEETIELGEVELAAGPSGLELHYSDQRFPVAEGTGEGTLREVLARQHYELADWRDASTRLNYRRFFDINSLAALREEDEAVFETVHRRALEMVHKGWVQGLRVDHVDGLWDPTGYLRRLRAAAPSTWLLVEKILEPGEDLPPAWPVDGTTGYDFINRLTGVFIDASAEASLTATYAEFSGSVSNYESVASRAKKQVVQELFAPDVARLARRLEALCGDAGVALGPGSAIAAVEALATSFSVYRTYLGPTGAPDDAQLARLDAALAAASKVGLGHAVLEVIRDAMVGGSGRAKGFAMLLQQLTGPVMAKGVEDTAFYRYQRLVCLNEVGCDPAQFGLTVEEFHAANDAAAERHPLAMLASSTHDTKRGEDVRARLSLLPQVAAQWRDAVRRWRAINAPHRPASVDGNTEYLIYQVLFGAWPLDLERARAFLEKALREAKCQTSWLTPDPAYEGDAQSFLASILSLDQFVDDLAAFTAPLVGPGRLVALAQSLLKLTAPGIPDIYQGTELWNLSLVDPDNRRPVDYGLRRRLLADGDGEREWELGGVKLHLLRRVLALRRRLPGAFDPGATYTPIVTRGSNADRTLTYARGTATDSRAVVVAVPRLVIGQPVQFDEVEVDIAPGRWRDALWDGPDIEGPIVSLRGLGDTMPVALWERVG